MSEPRLDIVDMLRDLPVGARVEVEGGRTYRKRGGRFEWACRAMF